MRTVRVPNITNHGIWADHDQACAVCHIEFAVYDCQTGVFSPCWTCQDKGWITKKQSPLDKFFRR